MNIIKPHENFDAWYIDNFVPSSGLVRAAAESFDRLAPGGGSHMAMKDR